MSQMSQPHTRRVNMVPIRNNTKIRTTVHQPVLITTPQNDILRPSIHVTNSTQQPHWPRLTMMMPIHLIVQMREHSRPSLNPSSSLAIISLHMTDTHHNPFPTQPPDCV